MVFAYAKKLAGENEDRLSCLALFLRIVEDEEIRYTGRNFERAGFMIIKKKIIMILIIIYFFSEHFFVQ